MFERYTEQARRVIFFSRYEASQYGSPCIETEHLLLGFFRADKALTRRLMRTNSTEALRKEIEARTTREAKIATSVDMPLSNQGKRALAYAAEEADRMQDRHIGPEHLLLGLLREKGSLAADLLASHGVTLERARECVLDLRKRLASDEGEDLVEIHGEMWNRESVQSRVDELAKFAWRRRQWKPLDILVEKTTGRIFFDLGLKDDPQFDLVSSGWPRTHCEICDWELNAANGPERSTCYTNGRNWICEQCYTNLLSPAQPNTH
jgi:hypothetical protein